MNVFSMFDGVGGFIVGLENSDSEFYKVMYSNQYEPSRKSQDAFEVGRYRFPDMVHLPDDIAEIPDSKFIEMRKTGVNMIVGGFPCQDYSVARSKKNEMGIEGKKGVLFWEIVRATRIIEPKYLILENVDRLLKAPSKQRGRDFGVMLSAFHQLGYSVEWRVINAAEYGRAQRRRRVFIIVYKNDLNWAKHLDLELQKDKNKELFYERYIFEDGIFAKEFPVKKNPVKGRVHTGSVDKDIANISDNFASQFWNSGVMRHGFFCTIETEPIIEKAIPLKEIILKNEEVEEKYFIDDKKLEKFRYLRGPKKLERTSFDGHKYVYSEGGMSEYDSLELPGRTMLTSEGSVNRSTHLLKVDGRYRLLTPIEAERLQDFPDDWTKYKRNEKGDVELVSDRMRMFFMGNALVTGIVKRIGDGIKKNYEKFEKKKL
ncbi:DNA cytosine methyltransferase [Peptoniphilus sp. KCTC 25270]|uniref:DNA (cytosine-5-)-methyltransferase n=1 Tax=Peptoniphilus sp. KCTC 25270 TaxID=2897414 RepID=UPI001E51F8BD|nr:DNA (cytosine-5-)-methyltransferase [Peptoniphilus sp. KCTC 25270]MCD1147508.1 DNA cytosine methyltransferase [Peptoniphilus sp. KCTC 25270]